MSTLVVVGYDDPFQTKMKPKCRLCLECGNIVETPLLTPAKQFRNPYVHCRRFIGGTCEGQVSARI